MDEDTRGITVRKNPSRTKQHITTILDEPDEVVRRQVGGFVTFLREKAVVGVAVGFIVGQQAQGRFVYVFINFLFILLAIYAIVKLLKLDKLDMPKEVKSKKSK